MPGVVRTIVGYTGGTTDWPTYRSIGDHTETVQIVFDPTKIPYEKLLDHFWSTVNPVATSSGRNQYMDAVFYQAGTDQKEKIDASIAKMEASGKLYGRPVGTRISPLENFYLAEGYHQKYLDRDMLDDDEWLKEQVYRD